MTISNRKIESTPKSEFIAGVRAELPIVVGVLPFGLIFGVLATTAGLPPLIAWSTSSIIFAGSAQFLALPLFAQGAPAVILIITTLIINLRHLLYSASLAPYARPLGTRWKLLLSYLLTDEAYVPTALHYQDSDTPHHYKHWYWFGAGLTLWLTWNSITGLGILVGQQLPTGLGLEFTLSLTFIGMIVPTLKRWPEIGAALSAGLTAVTAAGLPYQLNLMLAAVIGIAVGLFLDQYNRSLPAPTTQEYQPK